MSFPKYVGFLVGACLFALLPAHAQFSADDFLPPAQAQSAEDRQARMQIDGAVSRVNDAVLGDVIQADRAQDAINFVVKQRSPGAEMMRFGSGVGWVATGHGTYEVMENPTATRIAKREAYVRAFMEAKRYLAESLTGLSVEGRNTIVEQIANFTDAQRDLSNFASTQSEVLEQSVQMLLRGFVVYAVEDDTVNNTVYVSIVTTPKTRGQFNRPSLTGLEASSLQEGLSQVLAEIQSGLVPPVGGRMIQVPGTGEMGFVGFGSDVIRMSDNATLQARHRLNAERVAQMRASDALVGLLIGDDSSWKGKLDEQTRRLVEEFEGSEMAADASTRRFEQAREVFVNTQITTDEMQSVRRGTLPPGVMRRSFTTEDNAEVYSLAVYIPSVSQSAAQAAREMSEAQLIQTPGANAGTSSGSAAPIGRPGQDIAPGPTGRISNDQDL